MSSSQNAGEDQGSSHRLVASLFHSIGASSGRVCSCSLRPAQQASFILSGPFVQVPDLQRGPAVRGGPGAGQGLRPGLLHWRSRQGPDTAPLPSRKHDRFP